MVETGACIIEEIDREWLHLIIEAKNMGIEIEEIREYLKNMVERIIIERR